MISYKRTITAAACLITLITLAGTAYAATPTLSVSATGNGDNIQINVSGDPNVPVNLSYLKQNVGPALWPLGSTGLNGTLSTSVSTSALAVAVGSSVSVTVNGQTSQSVTWPAIAGAGVFSLSQTGLVMSVGQTATITASNPVTSTTNSTGSIYLSNNSNPAIANVNVNGAQVSIIANSNGSTVVTICSGSASTCASAYITVGNSGIQPLSFSISSVTVAPGQSVPITITGGTGNYTLLNNSNSSLIQAGVNGATVTLTTNSSNNSAGSAAITVCSSDISSCGIINATAGTASSAPVAFSQFNPTLAVGQNLLISIMGGFASGGSSASYYVSSNSNSGAVLASISGGNSLSLTGVANGSSTVTVCSSAASCASLTATVNFTSTGGSLQLSQSSISLLAGQVLTVTISGGSNPYSLSGGSGSVAQTSVSGNIISISAISAGSSSVSVCSSGGACLPLSIIVNASGMGSQLTISPNSASLTTGGSATVTLTGGGGYYPSVSTNPSVATVQINGSTAVVTGLNTGSTNVSICQSGGQCAILFVNVSGSTSAGIVPQFSQTNPSLSIGQIINVTVSGGTGSGYYVLSNTNPAVVQSSLNNNQLTVTGLSNGTSTVVICSSASSCASLTATVGATTTVPLSFPTANLPTPTVGQAYTSQLSVSGGSGSYTFTIASGSLPSGLTLSSGGLISGTPTVSGAANFTVTAADTLGASASVIFSINVVPGTSLSVPVTVPVDNTVTPQVSSPGAGSYVNGQLISEKGTIYIVYQNTKVGFANAPAFLGLGFSFKNVTPVTDSGLAVSPRVVVTAAGAHPRGTWLLSGKAVYLITPTGLIPVPDWDTFLNNGGQQSFIVKANTRDLAFPMLSVLTSSDARLKP